MDDTVWLWHGLAAKHLLQIAAPGPPGCFPLTTGSAEPSTPRALKFQVMHSESYMQAHPQAICVQLQKDNAHHWGQNYYIPFFFFVLGNYLLQLSQATLQHEVPGGSNYCNLVIGTVLPWKPQIIRFQLQFFSRRRVELISVMKPCIFTGFYLFGIEYVRIASPMLEQKYDRSRILSLKLVGICGCPLWTTLTDK